MIGIVVCRVTSRRIYKKRAAHLVHIERMLRCRHSEWNPSEFMFHSQVRIDDDYDDGNDENPSEKSAHHELAWKILICSLSRNQNVKKASNTHVTDTGKHTVGGREGETSLLKHKTWKKLSQLNK